VYLNCIFKVRNIFDNFITTKLNRKFCKKMTAPCIFHRPGETTQYRVPLTPFFDRETTWQQEKKKYFIILAAAPYTVRHLRVLCCSPGLTPSPGVDPALFPVGRYRPTPPSLGIAGPSCTVTGAAVPSVGLLFTEE